VISEIDTKSFITEDFLLQSKFAQKLFHSYAKGLPIIDYHCHLPPGDIANNKQFENLTTIWLDGDHYKWRAMRTLGIPEDFITGAKTDSEKFDKWAYTVPFTIRNPLYHWAHLELERYFNIGKLLNPGSAREIYDDASSQLQDNSMSARGIIRNMNVEVICTTDDPTDSLEHHATLVKGNFPVDVRPTFRPDKSFQIESPSYGLYVASLSQVSGIEITDATGLLKALEKRVNYFHEHGCRLSDHGLEHLYYSKESPVKFDEVFQKAKKSEALSTHEIHYFKYVVLLELARMYHARGWTQQYHLGALRNTNTRMMKLLGPDTGFDSIGDFSQPASLAGFLNELDSTDQLARTILYNLNPSDNEILGAMIGNFNDGSIKGKIQFGSAWWFLDQKDGMEKQINALSNLGLLSCFVGMVTDSRSFMSFPRHEYFRRILCNMLGNDVENGELPRDEKWLGKVVTDICYHNAKAYFNLEAR
jgi:glucuronate isomerase